MKLKRLLAGVLSAAMLLSIASALAFAEDGNITITYDQNKTDLPAAGFYTVSDFPETYTGTGEDVTLSGTVPAYLNANETPDYQVVYWSTNADGSGVRYLLGETYTFTEDTTLYAYWVMMKDYEDEYAAVYEQAFLFDSSIRLTVDGVSAPNVEYTYTLASATPESGSTFNNVPVSAGVVADSMSTTTVSFSVKDYAESSGDMTVTKSGKFSFADVTFSDVGVYYYTVTEKRSTGYESVTALTDSEDLTRDLYVVVTYNSDYDLVASGFYMYEKEATVAAANKDDEFMHYYGLNESSVEAGDYAGEDFIVTDVAKGNFVSYSKDFKFTITSTNIEDYMILAINTHDGAQEMLSVGNTSVTTAHAASEYMVMYNGKAYQAYYNNSGYSSADQSGDYWYVYDTSSEIIKLEFTTTDADPLADKDLTEYYIEMSAYEQFDILGVILDMSFTVTIEDPSDPDEGYAFYARDYYDAEVYEAMDASSAANGALQGLEFDGEVTWQSLPLESSTAYSFTATVKNDAGFEGIDFATVRGMDNNDGDDDGITYATFTNTGVILEFAPFTLMALAAGAAITLRAVKRRKQY